jgi:hypothetical protein
MMTENERLLLSIIPFREVPVSIDEFLDNPYYLKDHFPVNIYPYWRKQLRIIFPNNIITPFKYVILSGAIGAGKSSISEVITLYDIYKLSCLKSVSDFMGISSQNGYVACLYNIYKYSMLKFRNTVHDVIFDRSTGSPYFLRQLDLGNKFLNNLDILVAAKNRDMLSKDVIGFHLSELNMYSHQEQALEIINSANSRLFGRFIRGIRLFNHIIIDSSTVSDETAIENFITTNNEPEFTYVVKPTVWEPVAHQKKYFQLDPPSFNIYIGDGKNPPHIIKTNDEIKSNNLDESKIIAAPMELYTEAERDINLFLQEKCGIAIHSSDIYFSNLEKVIDNIKFHYTLSDVIILDFYDKEERLSQYVQPLINLLPTDRQIFIAIDNAYSKDLLGLAIGYVDDIVRSATRDDQNLNRSHISIPFTIGISHKIGQLTPINKVVEFIIELSAKYDIGHVWFDSFQSESIRQPLLQNNIEADISSVDITETPYIVARQYIYQSMVSLNDNPILLQGFKSVRRMIVDKSGRGKIVHNRSISSAYDGKDLLDPLVNLIYNISILDAQLAIDHSEQGKKIDYNKAYNKYMSNMNDNYHVW